MSEIVITNKEKQVYLNRLIGKVYKILPLFENNKKIPIIYLNDLLFEINSANILFEGILIEILIKLHSLKINKISHKNVRKIILESTNLTTKLLDEIEERNDINGDIS